MTLICYLYIRDKLNMKTKIDPANYELINDDKADK